jgi:SAM-dependent methyltransferase
MMSVGSRVVYKFKRFLRYIGVYKRTTTMQDGVKYRERSGISLRRALSDAGPGVKEYDVRLPWLDFDGRRGMRIRYTKSRMYADVGHDPRVVLYAQFLEQICPGMRVLELGCGTGGGSALLAQAVGPSGGIVAVDRDGESIRFARQRHRSDHCSFELGWIEALEGEINGAFEAVVCVDLLRGTKDTPEGARVIVEVGRVVRQGGLLVILVSQQSELQTTRDGFEGLGLQFDRPLIECNRSGWSGIIMRRPGNPERPADRDYNEPGSFLY